MDFLIQNFDKLENIPDDSFVITFDDGWIDFHDVAYPILSKPKIPATIYLTTGFVSKDSDIYGLNRIGINEEMITDWRGNFSEYVFMFSMFLESARR
jgi:hypothetical protein